MKRKQVKRILAAGLAAAMTVAMAAGCGSSGKDEGGKAGTAAEKATFDWWIYQSDGQGTYYEDYDDSPSVQYITAQYWDTENGGIGTEENGRKIDFDFMVPITGSEMENFNTMIATGEYPDIISLIVSQDSPKALHDAGVLMDITEYVEKYMPNYLAFLEENPELKPHAQYEESDGSIHYYALYPFADGAEKPWQGTCYRRDWVVKYAQPSEYVWDWEGDAVKENGHPEVTPLARAIEENNLEGWKKNEVKTFTADYGENPSETYTDNVIFPSGTSDPITVSDWEWMFEAFRKAIAERGWENDSSAYCTTVSYQGYNATGDLVSSFGGGTGAYYMKDGEVSFDGASENFKTYLECVNTWHNNGWLDTQFATRSADPFHSINSGGVNRGMVGLWCGLTGTLGTSIRSSCQNEEDAKDAFVMGCALPINDVYGTEAQMYQEPDALYTDSRKGAAVGISNKAKEKDLELLFTYFDWSYTKEGAEVIRLGLNEEQLKSVELDPDLYAENNLTAAYTKTTDENGMPVYKKTVSSSDPLSNALIAQRMTIGFKLSGTTGEYEIDNGGARVNKEAEKQWTKYKNTGSIRDFIVLLSAEESEEYNKVTTAYTDYQAQNIPNLIINGLDGWEAYAAGLEDIQTEPVVEYLQKYVDLTK